MLFCFTTSCNSQTNEDQNLISATIDSGFAELMWAGCHKWKLQDINFMILTELKETVYSFERQGNEYSDCAVFVNQKGNGCYGFACSNGNRVMIDFHYSDSWADPKQFKPAAWENHSFQNY
jgi:hypothetical protein